MFKDLMILTELILKDDLIERKEKIFVNIERFHMTSRRPYWCSKTIKRRPCGVLNQSGRN